MTNYRKIIRADLGDMFEQISHNEMRIEKLKRQAENYPEVMRFIVSFYENDGSNKIELSKIRDNTADIVPGTDELEEYAKRKVSELAGLVASHIEFHPQITPEQKLNDIIKLFVVLSENGFIPNPQDRLTKTKYLEEYGHTLYMVVMNVRPKEMTNFD